MSLAGGGESLVFKNSTSYLALLYSGGNSPTPCQCCMPGISFGERGILKTVWQKASWARLVCCNSISLDGALFAQYLFRGLGESLAWWERKHFSWLLIVSGLLLELALLTWYCQQDSHSIQRSLPEQPSVARLGAGKCWACVAFCKS